MPRVGIEPTTRGFSVPRPARPSLRILPGFPEGAARLRDIGELALRDPTTPPKLRRTDVVVVRWHMVTRGAGASPSEAPTIEALIEALDPEVRAAIDDVDRTLIALALQQSPWDRLRSASRAAQTLARIRDAIASQGG